MEKQSSKSRGTVFQSQSCRLWLEKAKGQFFKADHRKVEKQMQMGSFLKLYQVDYGQQRPGEVFKLSQQETGQIQTLLNHQEKIAQVVGCSFSRLDVHKHLQNFGRGSFAQTDLVIQTLKRYLFLLGFHSNYAYQVCALSMLIIISEKTKYRFPEQMMVHRLTFRSLNSVLLHKYLLPKKRSLFVAKFSILLTIDVPKD